MVTTVTLPKTIQNNLELSLRWICSALVFAFPVTVLAADEIGSAMFFILALMGIIAVFFRSVRQPLTHDIKLIFFAILLFFGVALLSYLFVDMSDISAAKLGRYARFLLAIPLYYLLRHVRIPQQAFWYGMALGAIVAGLVAMDQSWWQQDAVSANTRASGSVNAIIFGDLSLLMAIISLTGTHYFWNRSRWLIVVPILATALGLTASLLSGSRGGWLALPALSLTLLWFGRGNIKPWQYGLTGFMLVTIGTVAFLIPQLGVQTRIAQAAQEAKDYFQQHQVDTSTGERLEMWKAAWIVFLNHPLVGAGPGGYIIEKQALIDSGRIATSISEFSHPHNEYMAALATRGLLGLFSLLLLFLIPGRVFFNYATQNIPDQRLMGLCGLISVVAFAHFALTGDTFDRSLPITFLTFLLAVVPTLAICERQE